MRVKTSASGACFFDALYERSPERLLIKVAQEHLGPFSSQRHGGVQADTRIRAGDDGESSVKS